MILYRILRNAFLFVYAVFFDNDHRDAYIRGMDAFDNDQWCLLQVYMVGSITTSAIYVLFDNDSVRHWAGILVCYIGLGIRETACVRNLAIAIVFFSVTTVYWLGVL